VEEVVVLILTLLQVELVELVVEAMVLLIMGQEQLEQPTQVVAVAALVHKVQEAPMVVAEL
tara:strand:- start:55 stop:237 length:183 start_codon:yes stop_codon:yes gene_type:complete